MKVLLDIKDSKVGFVLELLSNLSFVKVKPLSDEKAAILYSIREGVEEMKLVKEGKMEARDVKDLIEEL